MLTKVLIIEDDAPLRESIVQTLEIADLDPIPTNGFTQARRSIRSNFAGVILSDIKMPDHDGFDVLKFVQSKDPELPVVLLTGHSDVPTAMRAVKGGVYDYLEKPCPPGELVDTLIRALSHRRLILENRAMRGRLEAQKQQEGTLNEQLDRAEKEILERALARKNGKVVDAARELGIARNTMYDRMARHNLSAKIYKDK